MKLYVCWILYTILCVVLLASLGYLLYIARQNDDFPQSRCGVSDDFSRNSTHIRFINQSGTSFRETNVLL